jgi:hypothetical protein
MFAIVMGVFLILHGLVHLLYAGQSWRVFELRPDMTWPDGSWLISKIFSQEFVRMLAGVSLVIATLGFLAGGLGLFLRQAWWQPSTLGAAAFSMLAFVLFWDGKSKELADQGGVGVLIDLAILAAILIFQWPSA